MDKRFIGIDIDRGWVRLAVAGDTADGPQLLATDKRPWTETSELCQALRELTGDTRIYGDRLAAALPASAGFSRWLHYPFEDPKKIEGAMRFAMAAQLPIPEQECLIVAHSRQAEAGGGCRVAASAVPETAVAAFLEPFDAEGIPLQILDLAPFAMPQVLAERSATALVALLREQEWVLALLHQGQTADYRLYSQLPPASERAIWLAQQSRMLQAQHRLSELPLYLLGPQADQPFAQALQQQGLEAEIPDWQLAGQPVAAEFLPAVTLAWRALRSERDNGGNFRRGAFALKGGWAALKKKLLLAGAALALTAAIAIGSTWLGYAHKAHRAEALQQQLNAVFRATLSESQTIVDIPLQMRQAISALRSKGRLLGVGSSSSALAALQEISLRMPENIRVDINNLNYSADNLRLEGSTGSYDDINRIARGLEQSPLFDEVQISDAKTSLDNQRIDFRLNLTYSGEVQP
jgi:general secretion pathway protein L